MSLKNLLQAEKQQVINLSVIKELDFCKYIIGDNSGLAILNVTPKHEKDIAIGNTVKLIKPEVIDFQTVKTNNNFRPLKAKEQINIKPSDKDIAKLENSEETEEKDKLTTFEEIKTLQSQSIVPTLTGIVTSVSRIIETKNGQYQIIGLKDYQGMQTSMNLYDSHILKV